MGQIDFITLLERIQSVWKDQKEELLKQGDEFWTDLQAIGKSEKMDEKDITNSFDTVTENCFKEFRSTFDEHEGGFGDAPKFARPVVLEFLLQMQSMNGELPIHGLNDLSGFGCSHLTP
eukprot:TRINITY_DN662_c0_g1_i3.p1 TRINITY_DN662_c0_g1~~TRINITY_DN662_c0_g1_i3.p1  ORF type:complete len:119 (-),score=41.76 TRINITY_DN662_c0_g1_i3:158-514(-)